MSNEIGLRDVHASVRQVVKLEKETGVSLVKLITQVPVENVVVAFKEISFPDLVEMVTSVPLDKLVHGLTIITTEEIANVPVDKLKCVLKYGNMNTVASLQKKFGSVPIITTLNKLDIERLQSLLTEDNLEVIESVIESLGFAN